MHVFNEADHYVFLEHPDEFVAVVTWFIDAIRDAEPGLCAGCIALGLPLGPSSAEDLIQAVSKTLSGRPARLNENIKNLEECASALRTLPQDGSVLGQVTFYETNHKVGSE